MLFEDKFLRGTIEVIDNFIIKKRMMERGDPRHEMIRTAVVIEGGAMRGVTGAGQSVALQHFGLTSAIDLKAGSSTGAPVKLYLHTGQTEIGRTIYWEECSGPEFLSLRRRKHEGPMMNIDFLAEVFRGNTPRNVGVNLSTLEQGGDIYTAVTETNTGNGQLVNLKLCADPIKAVQASAALPWVTHGCVDVDGVSCADGSIAYPLLATEIIDRFHPTDILILANRPRDENGFVSEFATRIVSKMASTLSPRMKEALLSRDARYKTAMAKLLKENRCRWTILWSDSTIHPFEQNKARLQTESYRAEQHLTSLLAERSLSACA